MLLIIGPSPGEQMITGLIRDPAGINGFKCFDISRTVFRYSRMYQIFTFRDKERRVKNPETKPFFLFISPCFFIEQMLFKFSFFYLKK